MRLARLPRPRPRPLRRALSARGNKGPPRPYDESYRGNAVRWTERQQGFRWSRLNTGKGLHVAAAWVYFGAFFGLGSVLVVYNFVTGAPRRIYEIYDHTVNPREPDPPMDLARVLLRAEGEELAELVRNPLYRDVGFGDDSIYRRRRRGGDWRYRFTDDELEELGRMGVTVDGIYARYGGPTKEQRRAILTARRFRWLRKLVDSGRLSGDEMRELKEEIRELNKNRDQLDAPTREAVDLWNSLCRVEDDGSGGKSEE